MFRTQIHPLGHFLNFCLCEITAHTFKIRLWVDTNWSLYVPFIICVYFKHVYIETHWIEFDSLFDERIWERLHKTLVLANFGKFLATLFSNRSLAEKILLNRSVLDVLGSARQHTWRHDLVLASVLVFLGAPRGEGKIAAFFNNIEKPKEENCMFRRFLCM